MWNLTPQCRTYLPALMCVFAIVMKFQMCCVVRRYAKIAQIEVFGHFLEFGSIVFLDFAYDHRWAWCLATGLTSLHEKIITGLILGKIGPKMLQIDVLVESWELLVVGSRLTTQNSWKHRLTIGGLWHMYPSDNRKCQKMPKSVKNGKMSLCTLKCLWDDQQV